MALSVNPWRISRLLAGASRDECEIEFTSGNRRIRATVRSDELWGSIKDVLVFEEYELLPAFALPLTQGKIVVDAGANAGLYSLKAAPFAKRVVSFEPSLKNSRLLARNVEQNGVRNVSVEQKAVWSKQGEVRFTDRNVGVVSQLVQAAGDYSVPTVVLDDLVDELGNIGLLKMDIEGAEYEVLLSCSDSTLRRIENIAAEFHLYRPEHLQQLSSIAVKLSRAGFTVSNLSEPSMKQAHNALKPWRNSLLTCNGRRAFLYRAFLTGVYGGSPMLKGMKSSIDIGTQALVFAYRNAQKIQKTATHS